MRRCRRHRPGPGQGQFDLFGTTPIRIGPFRSRPRACRPRHRPAWRWTHAVEFHPSRPRQQHPDSEWLGASCARFSHTAIDRCWYSDEEQPTAAVGLAKAVCWDDCPVRRRCLEVAFARSEQHGVWGGYDLEERVAHGQVRKWECRHCGEMTTRRDYCSDEHRDEGVRRNQAARSERYRQRHSGEYEERHRASARRSRLRRRQREADPAP